jgi:RNA polymerase sigma-70 factor (ECF subfamily)
VRLKYIEVALDDPSGEDARQLAEEVNLALDHLRMEYAQAFRLFHQDQLSYAEIAAAMERPIGTIKTWVHRARREIINQLLVRGVVEASDDELRTFRKSAQRVAG